MGCYFGLHDIKLSYIIQCNIIIKYLKLIKHNIIKILKMHISFKIKYKVLLLLIYRNAELIYLKKILRYSDEISSLRLFLV